MNIRIETIGRLSCRILDKLSELEAPKWIVVLCHGFGATGSDLVGIGEELISASPSIRQKIQFVFPEAPLTLDELGMPGSRAWWHLDLMRLQMAVATGRYREMCSEKPDGLVAAREQLSESLETYSRKLNIPLTRFVLGGFSQGAMLSTDVALQLGVNLAGLVAMSGSLLNEPEWRELAPRHAGLRVLQSHGRRDPLLPFSAAEGLRDLLTSSGINVDFVAFPGQHQIPTEVLEKLANTLEELIGSESREDVSAQN